MPFSQRKELQNTPDTVLQTEFSNLQNALKKNLETLLQANIESLDWHGKQTICLTIGKSLGEIFTTAGFHKVRSTELQRTLCDVMAAVYSNLGEDVTDYMKELLLGLGAKLIREAGGDSHVKVRWRWVDIPKTC